MSGDGGAQEAIGRVVIFRLDAPTVLLNRMLGWHWSRAIKEKRKLAWSIRIALLSSRATLPPAPFARAEVVIERRSVGTPDYDGAVGGVKWLLDCLCPPTKKRPYGLGLIADDNPRVLRLVVESVKVPRAEQGTTVTTKELL